MCLIYKVKFIQCEAIYIGITQQTSKKITGSRFSDVQHIFKNEGKSDLFAARYDQHFKYNISRTDSNKCMILKLVKHINPIGEMK